jgi:ketosteroid isomerase-like protein
MLGSSFGLHHRIALALLLAVLVVSAACRKGISADTHAADEATLRNLDAEWSKAAATTKDVDKTVSYYSDDAIVMPPNIPTLTGKEPIRALWKSMLESPGFGGGWKATKVEVAKSGDIGYVTGTYELRETGDDGKPMTDKGKFLEVWKKQSDGSWKCVADMFSSDLPTVPASAASESKPRH